MKPSPAMLEHLFSVAWSLADPRPRLRPHALLPSLFERHAAAKAATVDSWKRRSWVDPRCSRGSESEGQSPTWACDRLHGVPPRLEAGPLAARPGISGTAKASRGMRKMGGSFLPASTRAAGPQPAQPTSPPDRPEQLPPTEWRVPEVPSMLEGKAGKVPSHAAVQRNSRQGHGSASRSAPA